MDPDMIKNRLNDLLQDYPQLKIRSYFTELNDIKSSFSILFILLQAIITLFFIIAITNTINIVNLDLLSRIKDFTLFEINGMTRRDLIKLLLFEYGSNLIRAVVCIFISSYLLSYIIRTFLGDEYMIFVNARAIIYRIINNQYEVLVQTRNKPNEPNFFELPGGQINEYESIIDALKREVKEETGLDIYYIENLKTKILVEGGENDFTIECIKPFAVYQTLKGPVDSFGVFFKCMSKGEICKNGDMSLNPQWMNKKDLDLLLTNDKAFSPIDKAAVIMFFEELNADI